MEPHDHKHFYILKKTTNKFDSQPKELEKILSRYTSDNDIKVRFYQKKKNNKVKKLNIMKLKLPDKKRNHRSHQEKNVAIKFPGDGHHFACL